MKELNYNIFMTAHSFIYDKFELNNSSHESNCLVKVCLADYLPKEVSPLEKQNYEGIFLLVPTNKGHGQELPINPRFNNYEQIKSGIFVPENVAKICGPGIRTYKKLDPNKFKLYSHCNGEFIS